MKFAKVATAIAALALGAATALADQIDVEDFAKEPALSSLSMSPDGNTLVGLIHEPGSNGMRGAAALWNISGDLDTKKKLAPKYITPGNDRTRFRRIEALGHGKYLVLGQQIWTGRLGGCGEGVATGAEKTFLVKVYITDETLTNFEEPFKSSGRKTRNEFLEKCADLVNTVSIVDRMEHDSDHILIRREDFGAQKGGLYKYNLLTEKETLISKERGEDQTALLDKVTGEIIVKQRLEARNGDYDIETLILNRDTGKFDVEPPLTVQVKSRLTMDVQGFDDHTGQYFVRTDKFSDKAAIYFYDPKTNRFSDEPVFAHPEFSAGSVLISSQKDKLNKVTGFTYFAAEVENYDLDPEIKSIRDGLKQAYPGKSINLLDTANKMNKLLFSTSSPDSTTKYYLLLDKSKVVYIGDERPWMDEKDFGKTSLVYYNARDGLKIPGLLTVPRNWKKGDKPLKTMILPHGGPWVRDFAYADPWVHYFVSRDFAVLKPQYRGSTGWGLKHWKAGDEQWGLSMQDDKDDGAAWLVSEGIADKDRVAIMGYSYGGFAAMAASVRPNSPYQCAVAGAGVSNIEKLANRWGRNRIQRARQTWTIKGMDPIENVEKASIPIFIIHGDRDVRVELSQGTSFYNAIKRYTPAKLYIQKDAPHGFPYPEHRREYLAEIEKYLETECGPGGL